MPDIPDIHTPVPDRGHESLRQSVVVALDSIETQIGRLDNAFLLLLGTGQGLGAVLVDSFQTAIADLQTQVTDLQSRVATLGGKVL